MFWVPAQASPVTRPTFWQIGSVGEVIFYYLAAVTVVLFLVGVVNRVRRYARGNDEPIPRLDTLPSRTLSAARIVGSNTS
ncbi:MAG: Fe-S oxidoreductase, partial [Halobacteriales archaeon]|nr:Fe-S oxidoreductase [Halobacteriales archaeon]